MANIPIWDGSSTFNASQNPTAFGFYDDDTDFASDAPKVANWCAQRLGYPLVDVELQQESFFTAFEEAVTEYGSHLYQFQIINNLGNLIGYSTGSADTSANGTPGGGLNQIDISGIYGGSAGGSGGTGGGSGDTSNLTNDRLYSASLHVKRGQQKYNLLSQAPEYASTTLEWGANLNDDSGAQVFGQLTHSSSITITDTEGTTIHYRATTGSTNGGHIDGLAVDPDNPPSNDSPNMETGSGEFRRYKHINASSGEFVTGSYIGTSLGLGGILGSAAVGHLSASVDSFISTIQNGPHASKFIISSSLSSSGAHFVTLTNTIEGSAGNTTITNNLIGVTSSAAFTGGSSGLSFEASGSQIQSLGKRIEVKKIFHFSPAAINRYFDPYAGTGTGIQSLMQTFGMGNFSPGVNFMLMPMYFDVLKLQAIEMNDTIRKSSYHFELNSGKYLKLFPIPTSDYTLWFEYTMANSSNDLTTGGGGDGIDNDVPSPTNTITDQSNVPYVNPTYSFINAVGKQWIRKFCLALCKEMLGSVRGKYQSVPIPGDDTTLDYSRLLSEASSEKESLILQLREDLEATTTLSQNTRSTDESTQQQAGYGVNSPYQIYIH
tara:strand:+ start:195 stop:2006 length:1812 start_codon:yes stop_codon:yes gene_type:complete